MNYPRRSLEAVPHSGAAPMAYNSIQFQHGMSLPEFLQSFGTEPACCEAVLRARWPGGFVCPRCGSSAHCRCVRVLSDRR